MKILTFLSKFKNDAVEHSYENPMKYSDVMGVQTNDAPLKYFIKKYSGSGKEMSILAVVTPESEKTYERLQSLLLDEPGIESVKIPFQEGEKPELLIRRILEYIRQEDEILVDLTGGFRTTQLYFVLFARVLAYTGNKIREVVYSMYNSAPDSVCHIEDITDYLQLFSFSEGMRELTTLGSIRTLREYCSAGNVQANNMLMELLETMDDMSNAITLCRPRLMGEKMEALQGVLDELEKTDDILIRTILPAFEKVFNGVVTTPGLVRWYLQTDMLPQALSLYTEFMPRYILKDSGLFHEMSDAVRESDSEDCYFSILKAALSTQKLWTSPVSKLRQYLKDGGKYSLRDKRVTVTEFRSEINVLREYIDIKYNHKRPSCMQGRLQDLLNCKLGTVPKTEESFINSVDALSKEFFEILIDAAEEMDGKSSGREGSKVSGVLGELEVNGFKCVSNAELAASVIQDYDYIKQVRNMACHASEETIASEDKRQYFRSLDRYPELDEKLSVNQIKEILLSSIGRIESK